MKRSMQCCLQLWEQLRTNFFAFLWPLPNPVTKVTVKWYQFCLHNSTLFLRLPKFHSRSRWPGERVAVFVSQHRSLSQNCGFGELLNETLRDWIICGIKNNMIQKTLLTGADLKFNKAVQLAQLMEAAAMYRNCNSCHPLLEHLVQLVLCRKCTKWCSLSRRDNCALVIDEVGQII